MIDACVTGLGTCRAVLLAVVLEYTLFTCKKRAAELSCLMPAAAYTARFPSLSIASFLELDLISRRSVQSRAVQARGLGAAGHPVRLGAAAGRTVWVGVSVLSDARTTQWPRWATP